MSTERKLAPIDPPPLFVFGYSEGSNFRAVVTEMAKDGYDLYQMGCSPGGRFWAVFKAGNSWISPVRRDE